MISHMENHLISCENVFLEHFSCDHMFSHVVLHVVTCYHINFTWDHVITWKWVFFNVRTVEAVSKTTPIVSESSTRWPTGRIISWAVRHSAKHGSQINIPKRGAPEGVWHVLLPFGLQTISGKDPFKSCVLLFSRNPRGKLNIISRENDSDIQGILLPLELFLPKPCLNFNCTEYLYLFSHSLSYDLKSRCLIIRCVTVGVVYLLPAWV
jgi:hypothetical protein